MERRNFLKLALGVTAGAAVFAATAQAAPLSPLPVADPARTPEGSPDAAVTTSEEAEKLTPEQVHWHGHHRHWGWRRRHWRRHYRRWHRRHYW
ncbi:twin-arginine translocation signal domain-containing protein [Bradyrhizobium sp. LVM 105]|uniref:twin-arginine translocation signal domain-containing protein n=1 Tax=Bradyrhizobium sp. LVM 105 TaxID=2341115 RepID=UPI000F7FFFDB|nr:twin-arginine translocation signal domain-containing protein [Bradyrhizobium sp. LVM 105]RTE92136.1 twin-arginine translocation signal domain-containing protein [Bradyrhizobium sp. LVM 105]